MIEAGEQKGVIGQNPRCYQCELPPSEGRIPVWSGDGRLSAFLYEGVSRIGFKTIDT